MVPDPPMRKSILGDKTRGHARRHSVINWAKKAEPIEVPFGLWTRVGRRKHVLHALGHIGTTWQIRLNRPCAAAMRPYIKLL